MSRPCKCGHIRKAHTSVLPPKGACYMPGCFCNGYRAADTPSEDTE